MALPPSPVACDRRLLPTLPDAAGRCRVLCVREMQASVSTADAGTQCSLRFASSAASQTDFSDAVVQCAHQRPSCEMRTKCPPPQAEARIAAAEGEALAPGQRGHHSTSCSCPHSAGIGPPAEGEDGRYCRACEHQETPVAAPPGAHPGVRVLAPLVCVFCQAAFLRRADLLLHIRAHVGAEPYTCRHCSACFHCQEELARHQQRAHTGFPCGVCHKSFRDRSHLARHEKLHTGSKPFACSICPKTFARKEHVAVHEKLHSDDTPFVCRFCQKGFKWQPSLRRHERWHASLRPFGCDACEESFASKSALESHVSLHNTRYGRTYTRRRPPGPPPADSGTLQILP